MMGKPRLGIELDHHDGVYYGGQKLKGVVQLELEESITITGLELMLFGGSEIEWSTTEAEKDGIAHKADETYISDSYMLWGRMPGQTPTECNTEELSKGRHLFPFNWAIPGDAPSSFEGESGWIRYYAVATLKIPGCADGCHKTIVDRANFTVLRHLDLNSDKTFAAPVKESKDVVLTSAFCKPGRVSVTLGVSRTGYVPGEHIYADVDVHNMAARKIKATSLTLRRIIKYGCESPKTKQQTIELCRAFGDVIPPNKHHCWSSKTLQIPPSVPSRLDGCQLIDIKYELQLEVEMSPLVMSLKVPIIVGTIPLSDSYLTTWTYREVPFQQRPQVKRKKSRRSLVLGADQKKHVCSQPSTPVDPPACPDPTNPHLVHNKALISPKYRFYYTSTPVITKTRNVMPLECSPGIRRRSMFVCRTIRLKSRCEDTLLESVV